MANIKELNLSEQEGLETVLEKHESAWSEAEIAHLQARVEYLSSDDKARLDSVADSKPAKKAAKEDKE